MIEMMAKYVLKLGSPMEPKILYDSCLDNQLIIGLPNFEQNPYHADAGEDFDDRHPLPAGRRRTFRGIS